MKTGVLWAKAGGAVVAASGAAAIALASLAGREEAALVGFWVWIPGAAVWLIGELVDPSPGYRFRARPPFLERRTAVSDLGPEPAGRSIARRVLRVAFAVHTGAFAVYLGQEIAAAL